jgi:hypothetical protein
MQLVRVAATYVRQNGKGAFAERTKHLVPDSRDRPSVDGGCRLTFDDSPSVGRRIALPNNGAFRQLLPLRVRRLRVKNQFITSIRLPDTRATTLRFFSYASFVSSSGRHSRTTDSNCEPYPNVSG